MIRRGDTPGARLTSALLGRLLAGYAIALGAVQVLTIGLSVVGASIGQAMAAIALCVAVALGAVTVWRWPRCQVAEEADAPAGQVLQAMLVLGLVLAYGLLWWIAILSFDLTCDGNAYHLPPMSLWWRAGRIHWIDPRIQLEPLMNGYPKGVEVAGYLLARALNTSAVANGLNLIYLPLGVLGVAYLARRLGAAGWAALLAGAMYVLLPVTVWQAQTAYLDSAYASSVIAVAAAMVMAVAVGRASDAGARWPGLLLGAAAGLALGAKASAGATVALAFAAVLVVTWWGRRGRLPGADPDGGPGDEGMVSHAPTGNGGVRATLRVLTIAAVVALAVGGFWYVRNWAHTGTPLHPVGVTVAGWQLFPGVSVSEALWEEGNTPALFRPWPTWRRVGYTWLQGRDAWPGTIHGVDSRLGGLGYGWVLGGLPAALWLTVEAVKGGTAGRARTRQARDAAALWLCLVAVVALSFLVTPLRWWARYTLWLHAAGLPALAVALTRLVRSKGWSRIGLLWGLSVVAVVGFEGWLSGEAVARSVYPGRWPPTATTFFRPASWWRPHTYLFPEATGTLLSEILREDVPVAVGHMWTISPSGRWKHNMLGALTLPLGERDLMPLPAEIGPDDLIPLREEMRERGVRYVVLDDAEPVPVVLGYLAEREVTVPGFVVLELGEGS